MAWLEDRENSKLSLITNHGNLKIPMAETGLQDNHMEAGGLGRRITGLRFKGEDL